MSLSQNKNDRHSRFETAVAALDIKDAEAARLLGITPVAFWRIKAGQRNPSESLVRLAELLAKLKLSTVKIT